jgi:catechol 2,3-dioxygenase-like lactoylglutathione lyase family enzyme
MIRHLASIAEVVEDVESAVRFYRDVLGLKVQHEPGSPYAQIEMPGTLHFGLWSRRAAAETMFGDANASGRVPLGFSVGFEVESVEAAQAALTEKGWPIVQPLRKEDWGQVTTRFLSPSGALCEAAETPWARRILQPMTVEPPAK